MVLDHLGKDSTGKELVAARSIRSSPLFVPGTEGGDGTSKNLFIRGSWSSLLPHFRWALGCRYNLHPGHSFRITTDERLLQVWLGQESYTHRQKDVRENVVVFNNLGDFVGAQELFILRIGFLGHANRAMAGVILQTLRIREVETKPTWIVEDPASPFEVGSFSYSSDLKKYLNENFETIDQLSADDDVDPTPMPSAGTRTSSVAGADGVAMGGGDTVVRNGRSPQREENILSDFDEGPGGRSSKPKNGGYRKKKSGGLGEV